MDSFHDYFSTAQISTNTLLDLKSTNNYQDLLWTSEIKKELPIFLSDSSQFGSFKPTTIMELFSKTQKENSKEECLFSEKNGTWQSLTWSQYYKEVMHFSKALINLGIHPYKTVNILCANSPEWLVSFMGGIHACVIPVGIYNTNNSETCLYIAQHSEIGCLVIDSIAQFRKYEKDLSLLKDLKAIVFTCELSEAEIKSLVNSYCTVFQWKDFLDLGKKSMVDIELQQRIRMQKPGNVCNIVYTSGTTGVPKAALLSHDNLTWTARSYYESRALTLGVGHKMVSFLPLSHIAGQMVDIILPLLNFYKIYFAKADALSGSLIETLRFVKPTIFFAVPRIYEKFEERIKGVLEKSTGIKNKIAKWSEKIGKISIENSFQGKRPHFLFPIANYIYFSKIREALGLENTKIFGFGAAPMKKSTLRFFKGLNIPIFNNYGLSETSGPQFLNYEERDVNLYSAGTLLRGTESKISNPDKNGVGEICVRGRNRFMGYYKDPASTLESIDSEGYLHTGDQGYFNEKNQLIITGRIKELIVTAGGENVPPLPIEDQLKEHCKILSNVVVIGDQRKYLSALMTLKTEPNGNLTQEVLSVINDINSDARTSIDAMNDMKVKQYIKGIVDSINKKAISKAQIVKKWMIIPHDFTIDGGELTPTCKVKRRFIMQKYAKEIEKMYSLPKF